MEAIDKMPESRFWRTLFAIVLCIGLLIPASLINSRPAFAAESVYLTSLKEAPYFKIGDQVGFCVQPSLSSPVSGYYQKMPIEPKEAHRAQQVAAMLYFGYGGPGYEEWKHQLFPATNYKGEPITDEDCRYITHIVLADIYWTDGGYALTGITGSERTWYYKNVLMEDYSPGYWVGSNPDSVQGKLYHLMNAGYYPWDFINCCYTLSTGSGHQRIAACEPCGWVDLQKVSANPSITDNNSCYSLSGAKYSVYRDAACTSWVSNFYTNGSGYAKSSPLVRGTYYIKETAPSPGYCADPAVVKQVTVNSGQTTRVATDSENNTWVEEPDNDPAVILLGKFDGDHTYRGEGNLPQGSASLEGAEFTVKFYGAQATDSAGKAIVPNTGPLRTWVFKTDTDGFIEFGNPDYLVSGDDFWLDRNGDVTLPVGTVTVQETKAPEGYLIDTFEKAADGTLIDTPIFVRQVVGNGELDVRTYNMPLVAEEVIRGGIKIEKRDAETHKLTPQFAGSLVNDFQIVNENDNPVQVDGIDYAKGEVVKTITTENGVASTAANCLPFGTYSIREVTAGEGYLLTDSEPRTFTISENGKILTDFTGDNSFFNLVKRGDLSFVKVGESDMRRMGGVPFKLTSHSTGESHILVTDDNGYVNTHSSWNAHTNNTNSNDSATEGSYDFEAGVWFGSDSTPNDTRGALPYDTYTLEELPCEKNSNYTLVKLDNVKVSRDSQTVDLGTVVDEHPTDNSPYISTSATDAADGDKLISQDGSASIIDHVEIGNTVPNESYVVTGTLINKNTGQPILSDGKNVVVTTQFTASANQSYLDMVYVFDARELDGADVVVYEKLLNPSGVELADHSDINDSAQTVHLIKPEISTTATDSIDGDKNVIRDEQAKITDTVEFVNLIPNKTYSISGILYNKQSGQPILENGEPVTATSEFTPKISSGTVKVEFTFDSSVFAQGDEVVVFEQVYRDMLLVAEHSDLTDPAQTVSIADTSIATSAVDGHDGDKQVIADRESSVIDTVAMNNLVPGTKYRVEGQIHVQLKDETGAVVDSKPLLIDENGIATDDETLGSSVVASSTFTAKNQSESHQVKFNINSAFLKGMDLVVFEKLVRTDSDRVVATHEDPSDENQSFVMAASSFNTVALDALDGDKSLIPDERARVTDTISYSSLIKDLPGYTFGGIILDSETGLPLLVGEGAEDVDPQDLQAFVAEFKTAVGLEAPSVEEASDNTGLDNLKSAFATAFAEAGQPFPYSEPAIIGTVDLDKVDSVIAKYENIWNLLVKNHVDFEPERDHGTVDMQFDFDTAGIEAGKTLCVAEVLFKQASDGTAYIAVTETDPNNDIQSVTIQEPEIATELVDSSDGDHLLLNTSEGKLIDKVYYQGLIADGSTEYIVTGTLMSKATGEPLTIADKQITGTTRFTPNTSDGLVTVDFELDASELAGQDVVAFEVCTKAVGEGDRTVATHEDLDDEGQTVKIVTPEYGTPYDKTGVDTAILIAAIIVLLVSATALGVSAYRKRKAANTAPDSTIPKSDSE